jgi:hypothetical protein
MKSLKTRKVEQATSQGDRIAGALMADLKGKTLKRIRPFDLRELGYRFHDTPKAIFKKEFEFRMVLDEDTNREVDFTFVLDTKKNVGGILPHSFTHYVEAGGE